MPFAPSDGVKFGKALTENQRTEHTQAVSDANETSPSRTDIACLLPGLRKAECVLDVVKSGFYRPSQDVMRNDLLAAQRSVGGKQ